MGDVPQDIAPSITRQKKTNHIITSPIVNYLGQVAYEPTVEAMQEFTEQRNSNTNDQFWVLEHDPVFTLGQAGLESHLLEQSSIPLVKTDRGGQITYHGPGQVVVYLLLDMGRRGIKIKEMVRRIEQALIDTLAHFNILAERHEGAPGVYIQLGHSNGGAKIAALGLKVKRSCTYHGVSLNIDMDLSPFEKINPCGYQGLQTIDMKRMGQMVTIGEVSQILCQQLEIQWQLPL